MGIGLKEEMEGLEKKRRQEISALDDNKGNVAGGEKKGARGRKITLYFVNFLLEEIDKILSRGKNKGQEQGRVCGIKLR